MKIPKTEPQLIPLSTPFEEYWLATARLFADAGWDVDLSEQWTEHDWHLAAQNGEFGILGSVSHQPPGDPDKIWHAENYLGSNQFMIDCHLDDRNPIGHGMTGQTFLVKMKLTVSIESSIPGYDQDYDPDITIISRHEVGLIDGEPCIDYVSDGRFAELEARLAEIPPI